MATTTHTMCIASLVSAELASLCECQGQLPKIIYKHSGSDGAWMVVRIGLVLFELHLRNRHAKRPNELHET